MRNLFSLLGGIALGAVAALLLAPQSGKETRAQIEAMLKEKMPDLSKEQLEAYVQQIVDKIRKNSADEEAESTEQPA